MESDSEEEEEESDESAAAGSAGAASSAVSAAGSTTMSGSTADEDDKKQHCRFKVTKGNMRNHNTDEMSWYLPPMDQHTDRRAQMKRRVRVFMMPCS